MANRYFKGALVRSEVTFKNLAGAVVDPTFVVMVYETPAGAETSKTYPADPEIVKDSTGRYHRDIDANAVGTWQTRWYGTGAAQAAYEEQFVVRESVFT